MRQQFIFGTIHYEAYYSLVPPWHQPNNVILRDMEGYLHLQNYRCVVAP